MNIISIKLENFNEGDEKTLYRVWKRVLRHDPWWHFFYEGNYTLLRVSDPYLIEVCNWFKMYKITYIRQGVWVDNISTTKEFQGEFKYIFHGYSELAMKSIGGTSNKMTLLLDRVVHCFMNNMSSDKRRRSVTQRVDWEPLMIANCAIQRARTIGMIMAGHYDKKSK